MLSNEAYISFSLVVLLSVALMVVQQQCTLIEPYLLIFQISFLSLRRDCVDPRWESYLIGKLIIQAGEKAGQNTFSKGNLPNEHRVLGPGP
ncbi:hypothetical protein EJ08DRAFT_646556 [Tothia fuscella]|uniref:Uncharacterized protein n=1 Tax=Tothia fuscella TaxID=1048955 RepID=A0A9P4P0I0_9PEZI|nr:hypothetical protein EJ08DRAFT_646556 [Tothia fuscella]